jgi:hypothetical protein
MKSFCLVIFCLLFAFISNSQEQKTSVSKPDPDKKIQKVKAACGQCMFGMTGDGCTLAVRIKNKTYFVEGTGVDDHGDAHAKDGFCNKVKKADVQGEIKDNKFWATYFKLVDGTSTKSP